MDIFLPFKPFRHVFLLDTVGSSNLLFSAFIPKSLLLSQPTPFFKYNDFLYYLNLTINSNF